MAKFNEIDMTNWKESDIITDSLWIIPQRSNYGKHSNFYHGNFVPQIPYQFIKRYTKTGETVLDPFIGSGTTAIECENLNRNCIGIDIQQDLVDRLRDLINPVTSFSEFISGDSCNEDTFSVVKYIMEKKGIEKTQLAILHPPYADIIKFSNNQEDLSNSKSLNDFLSRFKKVVKNCISVLEKNRYLIIVIGDKYASSEWIPLSFYCMNIAKKEGLTLKSVIVKNMEGNRAKQNQTAIWRYRALASDYYIFKHEYIFVFKNQVK
jgi:DNA modification methylase